jgi:hypothetical protein
MAWTAPKTWVANAILTAAELNVHVRDNLSETAPAKATTSGSMIVGNGLNRIVERIPAGNINGANESTGSSTMTDLTTAGPSVQVTTGTKCFVIVTCRSENSVAGSGATMGYQVSGASALAADSAKGLRSTSPTAGARSRSSAVIFETGLTPGSNTFTAKYQIATSGTATFAERAIAVIPF